MERNENVSKTKEDNKYWPICLKQAGAELCHYVWLFAVSSLGCSPYFMKTLFEISFFDINMHILFKIQKNCLSEC